MRWPLTLRRLIPDMTTQEWAILLTLALAAAAVLDEWVRWLSSP